MSREPKPPSLFVDDDSLYTPEVGLWAEKKYRLLWYYADLFATSMKKKWDERVYIDLFSGAGYAKIRETGRLVLTSPLLAFEVSHPFDCYIFCDKNSACVETLKLRTEPRKGDALVKFIEGDSNEKTENIMAAMPKYGPNHRVLALCFVDPFRLSDFRFTTIEQLSSRFIDFLIHIPAMDPLRNEKTYNALGNSTLDMFLGSTDWRKQWDKDRGLVDFDLFIARIFDEKMKSLGYLFGGIEETVMVRSSEKNLPLYRLGFFSRNKLGERFWREARNYSDPQLSFF